MPTLCPHGVERAACDQCRPFSGAYASAGDLDVSLRASPDATPHDCQHLRATATQPEEVIGTLHRQAMTCPECGEQFVVTWTQSGAPPIPDSAREFASHDRAARRIIPGHTGMPGQ